MIWYDIIPYTQPTNMTCWSAATTMILGSNMSVGPGSAQLSSSGGLKAYDEFGKPDDKNIMAFAASHELLIHWPQSWTAKGLAKVIVNGPVVMCGNLPYLHAVVIGGISTDDTETGTTLTVFDPWPAGGFMGDGVTAIGSLQKYHVTMDVLYRHFPKATTYLLQAIHCRYQRHYHVQHVRPK